MRDKTRDRATALAELKPIIPNTDVATEAIRLRLIAARTAAEYRQMDLGWLMGRPQSFVSNYERGTRQLKVHELIEICSVLDLDALALLRDAIKEGLAAQKDS